MRCGWGNPGARTGAGRGAAPGGGGGHLRQRCAWVYRGVGAADGGDGHGARVRRDGGGAGAGGDRPGDRQPAWRSTRYSIVGSVWTAGRTRSSCAATGAPSGSIPGWRARSLNRWSCRPVTRSRWTTRSALPRVRWPSRWRWGCGRWPWPVRRRGSRLPCWAGALLASVCCWPARNAGPTPIFVTDVAPAQAGDDPPPGRGAARIRRRPTCPPWPARRPGGGGSPGS